MYIREIIWFLSWPFVIWFSYKMVIYALKKFEQKTENAK